MADDLPTLLRVFRAQRRWSQEHACLTCGLTFSRYRRIEAALVRPKPDELVKLAEMLDMSDTALVRVSKRTALVGEPGYSKVG